MAETKIKASQTDLIGGKNITLAPKYSEGGIDENTLVLFNFENQDFTNTGNGPLTMIHTPSDAQVFSSGYKKFGNYGFNGTYGYFSYVPTSDGSGFAGDFTIDGWFRAAYGGNQTTLFGLEAYIGSSFARSYSQNVLYTDNYMEMVVGTSVQGTIVSDFNMSSTSHHVALTCKWSDRLIKIFIDGVEKYSYTFNSNITSFKFLFNANPLDPYTQYAMAVDEYRFSNIVRYDGDFTPPTEAYTVSSLLGTAINCTLADNPYKFVDALPVTGEEGYIYGVYTNNTRDGYAIIQMFVWVNNAWAAFGAFDVDIDAANIFYKTGFQFNSTTGVLNIVTE